MSNKVRLAIGLFAIVLLAEGLYALYAMGGGFISAALANPATRIMALELETSLAMIGVWMWRDARAKGLNPVPWLVSLLFLGPVAPLFYLVRRPDVSDSAETHMQDERGHRIEGRATQPA